MAILSVSGFTSWFVSHIGTTSCSIWTDLLFSETIFRSLDSVLHRSSIVHLKGPPRPPSTQMTMCRSIRT